MGIVKKMQRPTQSSFPTRNVIAAESRFEIENHQDSYTGTRTSQQQDRDSSYDYSEPSTSSTAGDDSSESLTFSSTSAQPSSSRDTGDSTATSTADHTIAHDTLLPQERRGQGKPVVKKICAVCGDRALSCNFGAVACESCKAFFRRHAFKNIGSQCEGDCPITVESRSLCRACRQKKCYAVGMRNDLILSDEQKRDRRMKLEKNRMQRLKQQSNADHNMVLHQIPPASSSASGQHWPQSAVPSDLKDAYDYYCGVSQVNTHLFPNQSVGKYGFPGHDRLPPHMNENPDKHFIQSAASHYVPIQGEVGQAKSDGAQIHSRNFPVSLQSGAVSSQATPAKEDPLMDANNTADEERQKQSAANEQAIGQASASYATDGRGEATNVNDSQIIACDHTFITTLPPEIEEALSDDSRKAMSGVFRAFDSSFNKPLTDSIISRPNVTDIVNMSQLTIRRLIKLAKNLQPFIELRQSDQVTLLKRCVVEVMILRSSKTFVASETGWCVGAGGKQMVVKCDSPNQKYMEYNKKYADCVERITRVTRRDDVLLMLIIVISVFITDPDDHVEEFGKIDNIHRSYYDLVKAYCDVRYPGDDVLSEIGRLFAHLREHMTDVQAMILSSKIDDLAPLVREMFNLS